MKKLLGVAIIVLFTSVTSVALFDYFQNDGGYPPNVERTGFYSEILGENRDLIVHLPPDYDSTKRYPVMYVLDGSSEDEHIANKFDVLTAAGYSPPVIVVGIPNMTGENRKRNLTPPFMRQQVDEAGSPMGEGDRFLQFLESELIPFVEKKYPVSRYRMFSGYSRGGLLVLYSLIAKPDLFQARFCYSAPVWRQDNILVSKTEQFLRTRDSLNTFLYFSAGQNETDNIRNGFQNLKNVFETKAPAGLMYYSDLTRNADHGNNSKLSASRAIAKWSEHWKRSSGMID
jgi:predicted alpha/beta superfamily hydrolase